SAVPVTSTRHADASVAAGADYGFSRKVNSVPLMAVEFPHAAAEYAIVFSGTAEAFVPAVILGMRGEENLYLTDKGGWEAKYI
ncbi:SapC family protein, partial [Salmonella enterica]|uniref:SapC family protein n=1 Tax=Salmonella enterica TaxID=28901 RepID=UPI003CEA8D4B